MGDIEKISIVTLGPSITKAWNKAASPSVSPNTPESVNHVHRSSPASNGKIEPYIMKWTIINMTAAINNRLRLTTTDPVFRPAIVKKVGPIEKQIDVPKAASSPKYCIISPEKYFVEYNSKREEKSNSSNFETCFMICRTIK